MPIRLSLLLLGIVGAMLALPSEPTDAQRPGTRVVFPVVWRDTPTTPTRTPTPTITPTSQPTSTATPAQLRIQYRAFMQDDGWLPWQDEGSIAGQPGLSRHMRAFEIRVVGGPPGVGARYRAHIQNFGWQPEYIGTGGTAGGPSSSPIEALQVGLENPPANTFVSVEPFLRDWGPTGYVRDYWQAGQTGHGRLIEGFRIYVRMGSPEPARIVASYNANPRGMGYLGWQRNGELAGTTGKVLPLDSFKATLANRPEGMRLQYRCYVQDSDWQSWQDDDTGECGLFGTNKAIYAFEMRLVNAWPGSVLTYAGHIQNRGIVEWSSANPGANPAGTVGDPAQKFHLEAIRVAVTVP